MQRPGRQRNHRCPHHDRASLYLRDHSFYGALLHLDPVGAATSDNFGAAIARVDQVGPQGRLLRADPATGSAVPAVPAAARVSSNGLAGQTQG